MSDELRPAIFLDKDGTLVEDVPYNVDTARVRLAPFAAAALRQLASAGYCLVVISNQSGLARGYFSLEDLAGLDRHLRQCLAAQGVELDGAYYCPHHPEGTVAPYARECECRKPQPGLLLQAAEELGLDLGRSWMIGDILNDVEAGHRAGCRAMLLDVGGETEWVDGVHRRPDAVAANWREAAGLILGGPMQAGRARSKERVEHGKPLSANH